MELKGVLDSKGTQSLKQFWHWWKGELSDCLRPALRDRLLGSRRYLVLELAGEQLSARFGGRGRLEAAGICTLNADLSADDPVMKRIVGYARDADEVIVLLPDSELLSKSLTLPLATESNLYQVVGYELDRYTPFLPQQVYYGCCVQSRDAENNRLKVTLHLIARDQLAPALALLSKFGVNVDVIAPAAISSDHLYAVNLLPPELRPRKQATSAWRWILGAAAILLAVVWLFHSQQRQLEALQSQVDIPKEQAEEARRVKSEIRLLTDSHTFLVNRKVTANSVLQTVDALTRVLPDHTWISRMEWRDGVLRLQGESAEASALIEVLEAVENISSVRFASQFTKNPRNQKERFVILAELPVGGDS